MRLLVIIMLVVSVAAGAVLGALNADLVSYDLLFTRLALPKGAAVLVAMVIGWLLGGVTAWLGMSSRQRALRRQQLRNSAGKKKPGST